MKITKQFISLITVLLVCLSVTGQDTEEDKTKSLDHGSIKGQFDYVIEASNRYEQYKVVKIEWLNKLKSNVSDSLLAVRKELKQTREVISGQKEEIEVLKADLEKTRNSLVDVKADKDSITFLGASTTKSSYKTIMWSLVTGLFLLMLFFIFKFKRSNQITTEAKASLYKLNEEFDAFKKNAREREQKIKRELQDEINKHL